MFRIILEFIIDLLFMFILIYINYGVGILKWVEKILLL